MLMPIFSKWHFKLIGTAFLSLFGFACFTQVAIAQMPALPTADQILEKYAQAVGGRAAFQKLTSRVATGTLEDQEGNSFSIELWAKAPARFRFEVTVPNYGPIVQAYDGSAAWDSNPSEGVRDLSGGARANRIRNSQFYREVNLRQLYKSLRVTGTSKIGELNVLVVEATPAEGAPDVFYFAADSGLLLRRDSHYEDQGQTIAFETHYEDYREVDGVKLPFALRRVGQDNSNFTIRLATIQHNVPIDDSKFSKPAGP
jgi:outer membrane lipoprotein-sorting protein